MPDHLRSWGLPRAWQWGREGEWIGAYRHAQHVIDPLGRSLSLITTPEASHHAWLAAEASALGALRHRCIPTTYTFWPRNAEVPRGPGYVRHWIEGETLAAHVARIGPLGLRPAVSLLRQLGTCLAGLHQAGQAHGAVAPATVWESALGETFLLGWEWTVGPSGLPTGFAPDGRWTPWAPEWTAAHQWAPTPMSDQWQLGALLASALTGEPVLRSPVPPLGLVRTDLPQSLATLLDRLLAEDPATRYPSLALMLRDLDRAIGYAPTVSAETAAATLTGGGPASGGPPLLPGAASPLEAVLRAATGLDYELLMPLGRGAFGEVWRARDLTLEREVAIKGLHPHVAADRAAVERFRDEARIVAALQHPRILPVYDFNERGGVAYLVMALAEHGSLADRVARLGPRPLSELAAEMPPLLDGLGAAHTAGVLHRDLGPGNILIDRHARWLIGDFGIAAGIDDAPAGTTGTIEFAAPEQLLGEPLTPAIDCYALGAVTFYALTGRPPFGGATPRSHIARQLQGLPSTDAALMALPPAVRTWLRRALAPAPTERFQTAFEMRDAWRAAVATVPGIAPSFGAPAPGGRAPRATSWAAWWQARPRLLGGR